MASGIDEASLSKGQKRKLNALRKSLGDEIANRAFVQWLETAGSQSSTEEGDKNADMITEALMMLVNEKGLRIPRGGYVIRRGHGRIIVERAKA
ncbi:MAG: hypothetical protein AB7F98_19270 [Novosphingobium sp.]